jgi:hypothetical protein
LTFGHLPNQALTTLGKRNDGWRCPTAFLIGDDNRFAAFHHGNDRVSRSQIDSDDLAHC